MAARYHCGPPLAWTRQIELYRPSFVGVHRQVLPTLSAYRRSSMSLNAIPFPDLGAVSHGVVLPGSPSSSSLQQQSIITSTPLQRELYSWITQSTDMESESTVRSCAHLLLSSASASSLPEYRPPTKEEITLLQKAFASFYGSKDRNVPLAVQMLSQSIATWEGTHQSGDEIAGLYRVRGDARMELLQLNEAERDYGKAIEYLDGPDGDRADPEEKPASRLGRARAVRAMGTSATTSQALQASKDYETYFGYVSRLDDENDIKSSNQAEIITPAIKDGIQRNPYSAWEWGMVSRVALKYEIAAKIHSLAASAFEAIGDKPRAVICRLDEGLDLASGYEVSGKGEVLKVRKTLEEAISSTVGVDGRDVELLQRVVAKEGEARIALSGVLWDVKEKAAAESQFGEACGRLDDLNADYESRVQENIKKGMMPLSKTPRLGFSIDDIVGADEASCSRFKSDKFIDEKLVWSQNLQTSVKKFLTLGR